MFPILADIVWPALFVSIRMSAWWCVLASILIEAIALWRFAQVRPLRAFIASAVMNAVSALCGTLLLPLFGIRWDAIASNTYNNWFGWGIFNPITQIATWFGATLLTTVIECLVLWLVFNMPWQRRWVVVVLLANGLTVALACISALIFVPR